MTDENLNEKYIKLPLEWHFPDNLVSRYATNMVIQQAENEFIISFFEVIPPILFGPKDTQVKKVEELESVRAECVARVIVAADKLPAFISAMQENLSKFKVKIAETQGGNN